MIDPVSGNEYTEAHIKKAAEQNGISYDALIEQIKMGRVVLLEDGRILRRGYTTGTCAAAAAKAAVLLLADRNAGKEPKIETVEITTPIGVKAVLKVEDVFCDGGCIACVRVDSGDYKGDSFSNIQICAKARSSSELVIKAGRGIGIIKRAGLGKVGAPDIYPHIMDNIESNVREVTDMVEVELFVPRGEEIAKDTVLPELGIEGGIPIFGATGFVEPYTEDGYKHVIDYLIRDKKAILGVTTGEKSKRIAIEKLNFPKDSIIIAGNYVCYAIEKSEAKKKVIFTMPAKLCDMLGIDVYEHFELEFSSIAELVERLKRSDYERLKAFFTARAKDLAEKTGAEVYVFDNSGDIVGHAVA